MANIIRDYPQKMGCRGRWLALAALIAAAGCASVTTRPSLQRLPNAANALATPTYDGSGQGMHPGIAFFRLGWHGYKYWMPVTPYPNYDASKENPSILVSNDGENWEVPPGLTNPVDSAPLNLADPDLLYDPVSDQLWLYYIHKSYRGTSTHVMLKTSSDGINWSAAHDMFGVPPNQCLSPAVDKIKTTFFLWCVNAGPAGSSAASSIVEYRTSPDGKTWSDPQAANIIQSGYVIWHIEARYLPSRKETVMIAAAYPTGTSSGHTILFLARSPDGINWQTFPKPVLIPGSGWDHGEIYRSTFVYDESRDLLRVWYSAMGSSVWHTGYTEGSYSDLLRGIQN